MPSCQVDFYDQFKAYFKLIFSEAPSIKDVSIGDKLWGGDLEDGFYSWTVIGVSDHKCLVLRDGCDVSLLGPYDIAFATSNMHKTLNDAVRASVNSDRLFYGPRLRYAEKVEDDIANGNDISYALDGFDEDNV